MYNQTINIAKELDIMNYQVSQYRKEIETKDQKNSLIEWCYEYKEISLNQLHGFCVILDYEPHYEVNIEEIQKLKNQLLEYDGSYIQEELPSIDREELTNQLAY